MYGIVYTRKSENNFWEFVSPLTLLRQNRVFSCFCLSLHCSLAGLGTSGWSSAFCCFSSCSRSAGLQIWTMATPSFLLFLEIKFGLSNLCGRCSWLLSPDTFSTFACIYSFLLSIATAVLRQGRPVARIIVGLNDKIPVSDMWINAEDQRSRENSH